MWICRIFATKVSETWKFFTKQNTMKYDSKTWKVKTTNQQTTCACGRTKNRLWTDEKKNKISKIETGSNVTFHTVAKIFRAMGVNAMLDLGSIGKVAFVYMCEVCNLLFAYFCPCVYVSGYRRAILLCISFAFLASSSQFICKLFDWEIFFKHLSTDSLWNEFM